MSEKTYRIKPLEWVDVTTFGDRALGESLWLGGYPIESITLRSTIGASGLQQWIVGFRGKDVPFPTRREAEQAAEHYWREWITGALEEVRA